MAVIKIPARDIIVQVREADGTTWTEIGAMTSVKHNPGENEENTDTTSYDSDGNYEQRVMQRGAALTLEGFMLQDPISGARDPGQARCEAIATGVAEASLGKLRFRHPADTNWRVWDATFSLGEQGGETNDMSAWACTVTRSGASTLAAVV